MDYCRDCIGDDENTPSKENKIVRRNLLKSNPVQDIDNSRDEVPNIKFDCYDVYYDDKEIE